MSSFPSKLTNNEQKFFHKLEDYLDTKLFFFGSILRNDYIKNKSDIDVCIFSENESSTKMKLLHFLHAPKNAIIKVVWKFNDIIIYGYKINCKEYVDINCEICIYNTIYKKTILNEMYLPLTYNPYMLQLFLTPLKYFHYQIPIIPLSLYSRIKRLILNEVMGKKETVFFALK
jgi:predicted nucleotidyltransferase